MDIDDIDLPGEDYEATEDGRKVIIFSNFRETISKIADFMGDVCLPIINGSISPQRRQEIIDKFDKAPAGTVLYSGSKYRAEKDNGIVCGICENGQKIPLEDDVWEEVKT